MLFKLNESMAILGSVPLGWDVKKYLCGYFDFSPILKFICSKLHTNLLILQYIFEDFHSSFIQMKMIVNKATNSFESTMFLSKNLNTFANRSNYYMYFHFFILQNLYYKFITNLHYNFLVSGHEYLEIKHYFTYQLYLYRELCFCHLSLIWNRIHNLSGLWKFALAERINISDTTELKISYLE